MYITLAGKRVLRSTYERYCPIASYMNWHPGKTVAEMAKKYQVKQDTLARALKRLFTEMWDRYQASR